MKLGVGSVYFHFKRYPQGIWRTSLLDDTVSSVVTLLTVPQPDLRHGVSLGAARLAPVAGGGALTSMFVREYHPRPLVPHLTQSPPISSRQALSLVSLSASMNSSRSRLLSCQWGDSAACVKTATLLGVGCQPPSFMGRDLCLEFNKSTEVVGNGALTVLQRAG